MSPVRRLPPTPKGAISSRKQLHEVLRGKRFWTEHYLELADDQPTPTVQDWERGRAGLVGQVHRDEGERLQHEAVAAGVIALRRRERERIEWLIDQGRLVGEALDQALHLLKVRKLGGS